MTFFPLEEKGIKNQNRIFPSDSSCPGDNSPPEMLKCLNVCDYESEDFPIRVIKIILNQDNKL